jgi:hypothetical protein
MQAHNVLTVGPFPFSALCLTNNSVLHSAAESERNPLDFICGCIALSAEDDTSHSDSDLLRDGKHCSLGISISLCMVLSDLQLSIVMSAVEAQLDKQYPTS